MEETNNYQTSDIQNTQQPAEDFGKIIQEALQVQNLVKNGTLNQQQGQYYMSQLAQKSFKGLAQDTNNSYNAFEDFNKSKPDFFKADGRNDVLKYLKNSKFVIDKDEIDFISEMVEKVEKCAIERFCQQQNHEKALNDENEAAKRKLTANAQNSSTCGTKQMAFTREQISRMSGAEFTKYEPLIMEQLRKGQIR